MRKKPLTPQQIDILRTVKDVHWFPSSVAAIVGRQPGAVSRSLHSLEQDGLVQGKLYLAKECHTTQTQQYSRAYAITDAGKRVLLAAGGANG